MNFDFTAEKTEKNAESSRERGFHLSKKIESP
jgi:hypothetical protein